MEDFKKALQKVFNAENFEERKLYIAALYEDFYDKIFGMAYVVKKNEKLCEDAVQNLVIKLLTMDEKLFPLKNPTAWLFSVIKNQVRDLVKKESDAISIDDLEQLSLEEKSIDDYLDMAHFNALIKDLDERRRKILTLKIVGGYTHREIAQMLGEKQSTVQWLYCTAIKSLKAIVTSLLSCVILSFLCFIVPFTQLLFFTNKKVDSPPNQDILPPNSFDSSSTIINNSSIDVKQLLIVSAVCLFITMILSIVLIIFLKSEHKQKRKK